MSLEEELVFEALRKKENPQYIKDAIKGLEELRIKVDKNKVKEAIIKYKFFQKYEKVSEKFLEEFKREYPSVISAELEEDAKKGWCHGCDNNNGMATINVRYTQIKELGQLHFKHKRKHFAFGYCFECGFHWTPMDIDPLVNRIN